MKEMLIWDRAGRNFSDEEGKQARGILVLCVQKKLY